MKDSSLKRRLLFVSLLKIYQPGLLGFSFVATFGCATAFVAVAGLRLLTTLPPVLLVVALLVVGLAAALALLLVPALLLTAPKGMRRSAGRRSCSWASPT
jgi:hypothetical protein